MRSVGLPEAAGRSASGAPIRDGNPNWAHRTVHLSSGCAEVGQLAFKRLSKLPPAHRGLCRRGGSWGVERVRVIGAQRDHRPTELPLASTNGLACHRVALLCVSRWATAGRANTRARRRPVRDRARAPLADESWTDTHVSNRLVAHSAAASPGADGRARSGIERDSSPLTPAASKASLRWGTRPMCRVRDSLARF